MYQAGWEFDETKDTLSHQLHVTFSRRDWHGVRIGHGLSVSRSGLPQDRPQLIRDAAREARALYEEFRKPPGRWFDKATQTSDWWSDG